MPRTTRRCSCCSISPARCSRRTCASSARILTARCAGGGRGGGGGASGHLPLRGLEEHDVARFVEADRGSVPARSLVSAVHRTTGGNPFFLGEIVRGIQGRDDLDSGALVSRDSV